MNVLTYRSFVPKNYLRIGTSFKSALDKYLSSVPDEPLIPGMTGFRRVEGNSLLDWSGVPGL